MRLRKLAKLAGGLVAAGIAVAAAYGLIVRPWHLRWGATESEVARALPGDGLVPSPKIAATHAITIRAAAAQVWPWIVQIGRGRGGFYSYDWIENLMGLKIRSADRVLPEFQKLKAGDVVPFEPGGHGPPVAAIEPNRYLVLGGRVDATNGAAFGVTRPDDAFVCSWTFFLEPAGDHATRLIERFRLDYRPGPRNTLFYRAVLEPGSFVMQRKMLLGIRERAERLAAAAPPEP